jgi:streptogramin lyase
MTLSGAWMSFPTPSSNPNALGITAGPDGALWFVEALSNKIGRITVGGTVSEFAIPTANSGAMAIVAGPDGNLWFTEEGEPNQAAHHDDRPDHRIPGPAGSERAVEYHRRTRQQFMVHRCLRQ